MKKEFLSWKTVEEKAESMARAIASSIPEFEKNNTFNIYGVPRGGIHVAQMITTKFQLEGIDAKLVTIPQSADIIVDDIIDSGKTKEKFCKINPTALFASLITADRENPVWYVFPWESQDKEVSGPVENIRRVLQYIGEDVNREGLVETPHRILRSYERLFGGYKKKPQDFMKTFTEGACDEMVILKDITFYSTCEHHMLPFYGVAHVAYIPNKKVIGVSKLSRLVDMYSRRMQIQERIGTQVVDAIMEHLEAKGAACVLEAQHFCMTSRGVENQTARMVTSALRGVFRDDPTTRAEFMSMIRGK